MKKRWLAASLAALMALSMTACGGGKAAETTAAPAETKVEETKAEESKAEDASKEEKAEKAPEDYTGSVVVYSPHDADPLNAGVNLFMEKYPNVKVEVVAAGTGELCNRIAAESANPIADVLWGGGADSWQHSKSTSSRMYAQTMSSSVTHTKIRMVCGSVRVRFRWLSSITRT
ncbi:MAG: hypothetical protein ACLSE4_14100 [Clostridium sp.]